jgi:hypothetical protein
MRILSYFAAVALLGASAISAQAASMTAPEREHLVAHLEMTASWIQDETAHLSKVQLAYRAAEDKWSVIDVLEHLNLAEPIYWKQFQDAMKAEPVTKKPAVTDEMVLWYGIDRTEHQKTSPNKVPHSSSTDIKARLEAFRKLHAEMLDYARKTDDDLRAHAIEAEGTDMYQWLLMISTHAQRHILQIREIKASPNFPKA